MQEPPLSQPPFDKDHPFRVLLASRSFGKDSEAAVDVMRAAGCVPIPSPFDRTLTEKELLQFVPDIDALVAGSEPVTARVIAAAPRLKIIARHGVGYDNVDVEAARARGIPVALTGPVMLDSVADMAMTLMLAIARRLPEAFDSVRAGEWKRFIGVEMSGKTLGVVGLGQIGRGVCRRAAGFGMRIVAVDTRPDLAFATEMNIEYLSLNELLRRADFVTVHAPASPETRGLIGAAELSSMKPTAFLINTARGELVDETALYKALTTGQIAGAAVDVLQKEPPGESPLLALENFIATPHVSSQTTDSLRRMGEVTAENVVRAMQGRAPLYQVV